MGDIEQEIQEDQEKQKSQPSVSKWSFGSGEGSWQGRGRVIKERTGHLYNNSEMSDILVNACDENWWFGDTVKDFNAHKFLLGTASPVFHKILYDWNESEDNGQKKLILHDNLEVSLTLVPCFDYQRLEVDGIPPIAVEALLEYVYKDTFNDSDFENGYSRNLLWRLWHASRALEMEYLHEKCTETLHETMCEDTVFWDLNYAIKYKSLGTEEIRSKVLKNMECLEDKLFDHPNFVWLDHASINEILTRRKENSCEPMTIYNNLLRWSLYQLDRSAVAETEDGLIGAEIPIYMRLEWISQCRNGAFDHVTEQDMDKYLSRGLEKMPWTEMSQSEFLVYVVNARVVQNDIVLPNAIKIMEIVVNNPDRLQKSAYGVIKTQNTKTTNHVQTANNQNKEKSKISALFNNSKTATNRG